MLRIHSDSTRRPSGVAGYAAQRSLFPLGAVMNKNLTLKMGNCNHRSIAPALIEQVPDGSFDELLALTNREPMMNVIAAYKTFDKRKLRWLKVKLDVP